MAREVDLIEVCRVTTIAETTLEKVLLDQFQRLGARGYTCSYCIGKGRHEVIADPYTGRSLVKIVVLAPRDVAVAMMRYVHNEQFRPFPVLSYMDTVLVYPDHSGS